MNAYRRNLLSLLRPLLASQAAGRALDFGAGDGWFARVLQDEGLVGEVVALDVQRRRHAVVEPLIYEGRRLPFADRSFDLVYALDALHHCLEPRTSLAELTRCSSRLLLLKDHTYRRPISRLALAALDEIGNRRFGVASPHRYQQGWEWLPWIEDAGFERVDLIHPARCERRPPLSWFANRLQFIGLWRRA